MDNKKFNELRILRKVYPQDKYIIVKENEKPDFILSDKSNNIFGVEVTEYFDSQTSGRFKKIPNYLKKLINSKFIHKEDIGVLQVGVISIVDNKGNEISIPDKGVYRQLPQLIERLNVLKNLVAEKNIKCFNQYEKSIPIDLLIYDSGDLIAGLEIHKKQMLDYLYKQGKVNTLVSPFRKIILLIEESKSNLFKILLKSA